MKLTNSVSRKITLLIPSFGFGGVEKVMIFLANGFVERGYDVTVLSLKAEGDLKNSIHPSAKIINCGVSAIRYANSFFPLIKYFTKHTPDVFISANYNDAALFAHIVTRNKSKIIITVHSSTRSEIKYEKRKLARRVSLAIFSLLGWRADAVVAVSHKLKDEVALNSSVSQNRINVIHNPVISGEAHHLIDEPINDPWFVEKDKPVIMAMGRLTYTKRFDLLIKAFSLLSANIEAKLFIAGDGEERANLEALAKRLGVEGIISLPGFIKNPFPYLSRADLFVLSSFSEGFSLVLVEALFGGASIVSTDCGSGPREILCGGKFGTLVEVNDERALAQAMKLRLENPFPREAQAQRALDFSTDAAVDKYTKLIENVLDK